MNLDAGFIIPNVAEIVTLNSSIIMLIFSIAGIYTHRIEKITKIFSSIIRKVWNMNKKF
ncbi:hypothetical protein [Acidianus sp. HS-5]|uniref:hypothetical protein n=1 Tax=Acidianus sp. HS-5 TaxID=2886040 RepID=UPI001F30C7BA|nr:hypothetical protein [Acidianus sp. HS-5]BDC17700.1 hypothetical protein HS5_05900 [Acidianus sp. HS-5]